MAQLKFNAKLSQLAIDQIELNPDTHDQFQWHRFCGTAHCWYGWCEVLTKTQILNFRDINSEPAQLIGLRKDSWEWQCITSAHNTIDDIKKYHSELVETGKIQFNNRGYDADGFKIDGFDRNGFHQNAL